MMTGVPSARSMYWMCGPFDVLDVQNAVDQVQFLRDAFAVLAEHGESLVVGGTRRICARDHVFVDVVLLVVREGECDFALYEHGRESVV